MKMQEPFNNCKQILEQPKLMLTIVAITSTHSLSPAEMQLPRDSLNWQRTLQKIEEICKRKPYKDKKHIKSSLIKFLNIRVLLMLLMKHFHWWVHYLTAMLH